MPPSCTPISPLLLQLGLPRQSVWRRRQQHGRWRRPAPLITASVTAKSTHAHVSPGLYQLQHRQQALVWRTRGAAASCPGCPLGCPAGSESTNVVAISYMLPRPFQGSHAACMRTSSDVRCAGCGTPAVKAPACHPGLLDMCTQTTLAGTQQDTARCLTALAWWTGCFRHAAHLQAGAGDQLSPRTSHPGEKALLLIIV